MNRLILGAALASIPLWGCAQAANESVDAAPGTADASATDPDASETAADAGATDAQAAADGSTVDAAANPGIDAAITVDAAIAPDASLPDAMLPDAMLPDATPCTPTWQPLLTNGGFESGNTTWTKAGNGGDIIKQNGGGLPFNAHAGTWAAHLVGFNSADQSLSQTVTIPATATGLRLRGYKCYVTTEPATTVAYDTISFQLRNSGGTSTLETLDTVSNADVGSVCSWTAFEYTAANARAGQTIQLTLAGVSDNLSLTSFVVDTLVLEALACP